MDDPPKRGRPRRVVGAHRPPAAVRLQLVARLGLWPSLRDIVRVNVGSMWLDLRMSDLRRASEAISPLDAHWNGNTTMTVGFLPHYVADDMNGGGRTNNCIVNGQGDDAHRHATHEHCTHYRALMMEQAIANPSPGEARYARMDTEDGSAEGSPGPPFR